MFLRKGVLKIKQLYWNQTSSWVFSCKFAAYFQNTFSKEHLWVAASVHHTKNNLNELYIETWFNCCQQLPNWACIEILNDSITWTDHPIHCRVRLCKFISPAGTYSIDVFNAKIKKTTLIQKQDSNIPKTSGMKLIVSEHVTIVASSIQFDGLNLLSAQNGLQKSTLDSGFYQTSIDTSLPQKLWSRHYRQISRVKNKTDRQPSSVLMYMQVSDNFYFDTFSVSWTRRIPFSFGF